MRRPETNAMLHVNYISRKKKNSESTADKQNLLFKSITVLNHVLENWEGRKGGMEGEKEEGRKERRGI